MQQSLSKSAYEQIRYKLATGQLTAGTRLSNRKLASELGVSVIPVREAMSQLVTEGFLEHKPKVGTFVAEISQQEILDICELREALECHALRKAIRRITSLELNEIKQSLAQMERIRDEVLHDKRNDLQRNQWQLADAGFHMAVLRGSGNRRVLKMLSQLRMMTYVFGHQEHVYFVNQESEELLNDLNRVLDEHRDIFSAIEAQDTEAALTAMTLHLQRATETLLKTYEQISRHAASQQLQDDSFTDILQRRIHNMETEES